MGLLIRKQKGLAITGIGKLAIITFIMGISFSLIDTIWAVYLYDFLKSDSAVGFLSTLLTIISFISFFLIVPLIEKTNKSKIFSITLLLFGISYILFAINTKFYIVVILAFILTILHTLRITSFGIIVKDKSNKKNLSRNEGVTYTFMNTAWLIGPLIAGLISEKYGIPIIFLISAIFIFLCFFLFKISKINDSNIDKKANFNAIKNFKEFFKNKERTLAYFLGGGVNFWWSLIYLFIPLFIINNGLNVKWVGYFLFAIPIPLILFQYPFAKLAGKIGFKKIFKIGFFIPAILAMSCFFITNVYLILFILILAGTGLAMLEANTEAYFFDVLRKKEELKFYALYNTTIDVNHFIGRLIASIILLILPFKYLFLFFGFSMLFFSLLSSRIKNIIEKNKK